MKQSEESKDLTRSLIRLIGKHRKKMSIDEVSLTIVRLATYCMCLEFDHEKAASKIVKIALEEGVALYRAQREVK